MDYKELIKQLRDEAQYQAEYFFRFTLRDELSAAASAIETLLAEREEMMAGLRSGCCDTCKYLAIDPNEPPCNVCGEGVDNRWQWRGLTSPDQERKEEM